MFFPFGTVQCFQKSDRRKVALWQLRVLSLNVPLCLLFGSSFTTLAGREKLKELCSHLHAASKSGFITTTITINHCGGRRRSLYQKPGAKQSIHHDRASGNQAKGLGPRTHHTSASPSGRCVGRPSHYELAGTQCRCHVCCPVGGAVTAGGKLLVNADVSGKKTSRAQFLLAREEMLAAQTPVHVLLVDGTEVEGVLDRKSVV